MPSSGNDSAPSGQGRGAKSQPHNFHVQDATAEPLLQRLELVQKAGSGWRARCPACGGKSRKLSVAASEGRVLVHCFGGCDAATVLDAVGLRWSDIMPPRTWPQSPEERRRVQRALRECGWSAALATLATEGAVLHLAARQLVEWQALSVEDDERFALACIRIEKAALVLAERDAWRPDYCYPPARVVAMKTAAVSELRRQLEAAERDLEQACLERGTA